jgi:hypothetical protein
LPQQAPQLFGRILVREVGRGGVRRETDVPIALDAERCTRFEDQPMRRRQDRYTREDGVRMRHVLEAEIMTERFDVELASETGNGEQRLDLGGKVQLITGGVVVERLLAEPIAA